MTDFDERDYIVLDAHRQRRALPVDEAPAKAPLPIIKPTPFILREPAQIQPREWIYGGHFIRKYTSSTVAAGGTGKSSLLLTEAVAMSTGRALLHHPVKKPVRVWYWCGEDPVEELERRLAGICLHYGITQDDFGGRLFIDSGRDTAIKIAVMERGTFTIAQPVIEAVKAAIIENRIDILLLDPFISTHSVSENDNGAIDAVAKTWGKIAGETNCSIDLAHHIRKVGGGEATVDDARGASALKDACRSVRTLNKMSKEDAEKAGLTENHRLFFRVDYGDKANMRPPADSSEWHKMASVPLGNGREGLLGDEIGVPTVWTWPDAFAGISISDTRAVQERLATGEHAENVQASDWAGFAVGAVLGINVTDRGGKARVKSLLSIWIKNGALRIERVRSVRDGRDRPMIVVGDRV